jgi:hypothetical protein
LDKFPEAFRRFEKVVDVDKIESFRQLEPAFGSWAGRKWHGTYLQREALTVEARKHGIPGVVEKSPSVVSRRVARVSEGIVLSWRHEVVSVRGHSQDRYRDIQSGRFIQNPNKR